VSEQRRDAAVDVVLQGRYANFFRVGYNAFEVLIDFGQLYAGSEDAQVHTRIVTSPAYAKALSQTLVRSLRDYERSHGRIPDSQRPDEP
jgi:Protein of unknown function (DUF3467)